MIIVDSALEKRHAEGKPVRVGLIGAGAMGRGVAQQILSAVKGMRLVAVGNRTLNKAELAYTQSGVQSLTRVETVSQLEAAVAAGRYAVTEDATLLCEAGGIDVIIELTGEIDFGADIAQRTIAHGKHLVLMNAELDCLVGPLLKKRADRADVVYSNADGDQPGVAMNLFRFVRALGYGPVLVGNMKGMLDRYRTPATQERFARENAIDVHMATSFADGTKLCMEQAVLANATGFRVSRRGMYGPACSQVSEAAALFPLDELLDGGRVDYVLGAEPGPGVFVLGYDDKPNRRQLMQYFKMGEGPLYVFYVPYHLPHLETPLTAARAALFHDAAVTPLGAPVCDVIAVAKRDLAAGEVLDGIGGFSCYGTIDNADVVHQDGLLPMSLSKGCRLNRSISKDDVIAYADVEQPRTALGWQLRSEQDALFYGTPASVSVNRGATPHHAMSGSGTSNAQG